MADTLTLEPHGIEEICRGLDKLPVELQARGFLKALEAANAVIEPVLQSKTPIRLEIFGERFVVAGGALANALQHQITLDSQGRGGVLSNNYGRLGWIANILENGWALTSHWETKQAYFDSKGRTRFKKSGGHQFIKQIPPRHFVRDTADQVAQEVVDAVANSLTKTVNEGILEHLVA